MPVRIQVNEYYIQLLADSRDQSFIQLLTALKGIEKMRTRDTYRCSLRKLPEVLKILRGIESVDQLPEGKVKQLYTEEMQRRQFTRTLKELGPDMTSDWLWPHQCLGIELAQVNRRYNFYYDTRTGKTLMMLKIMYDRLRSGDARRCLVICPSNIIQAWLSDAKEHFPELKLAAFYGDEITRWDALHRPAHIVVWATEQVADNIELLKQVKFDMCTLDESSKIKNYSTKIAQAARDLSVTIPSWYNLSATPAPNGKHEYYTQMMCLDPYVFSPARTRFVEKYFDNKSRSRNYEKLVIKWNMEDEFMSIVEDYSIYVDQAVMPTAGKEWHVVQFKLEPETAKIYSTMCSDMYAEVEGVTITADMSAAMRAKLNQITSGFIMDTEARKENAADRKLGYEQSAKEVYRISDGSRINCLKSLLADLGDTKCVIWANYTEEFRMLEELLGDRARYVRGGTSIADKEQWIYKEFKGGNLQYLVCHPLSVGLGINLTEAHNAIYFSLSDSWEAFKQSSERIYGHIKVQPNKCHYWILQAQDTVNELIYDNVINKRDASTGFLDHLRSKALC
jgi:SNF2 family DNA or RNA helicase